MYFYQTNEWRLSEVNKDFSVCPSYPPLVAVPKDTDDDSLRKIATFRHGGRFPVLSYYHRKNGMVSTWEMEFTPFKIFCVDLNCMTACTVCTLINFQFQVIMRAGQPLTGTNGRRCKEDEKLINATLRLGKRGYIIDTRTINVAQQAKARGGGFESEANYPQWRRIHKAIERWKVVSGSIKQELWGIVFSLLFWVWILPRLVKKILTLDMSERWFDISTLFLCLKFIFSISTLFRGFV